MKCKNCQRDFGRQRPNFCPSCGRKLKNNNKLGFLKFIFKNNRHLYSLIIIQFFIIFYLGLLLSQKQRLFDKNNSYLNREQEDFSEQIEVEWEVEKNFFPLTYAGENKRFITLKIDSSVFATIKTKVSAEGIIEPQTKTINLKPQNKIYYLTPRISQAGYKKLEESQRSKVKLEVYLLDDQDREKEILRQSSQVLFYSINDIIWMEDGTNNAKYIVRLIDKDKNQIQELVRKASNKIKALGGQNNSMVGSFGTKEDKKRELMAIFLAISKDYDINYISSPFSYKDLKIQQIKTPGQVIDTKSGLCIELTLLIAAALENVGQNPVIVLTPDHAWVGIETSPKSQDYVFLETTALEKSAREALRLGRQNWEMAKKLGDYKLLNVNELRGEGLLPIEY
ncbi:MAG: hypothetical protein GF335_04205 [Candidatus Moranbacteria bacterium]|nr:hypothetical protein [Candidatus Moranbacteria bacterium]